MWEMRMEGAMGAGFGGGGTKPDPFPNPSNTGFRTPNGPVPPGTENPAAMSGGGGISLSWKLTMLVGI